MGWNVKSGSVRSTKSRLVENLLGGEYWSGGVWNGYGFDDCHDYPRYSFTCLEGLTFVDKDEFVEGFDIFDKYDESVNLITRGPRPVGYEVSIPSFQEIPISDVRFIDDVIKMLRKSEKKYYIRYAINSNIKCSYCSPSFRKPYKELYGDTFTESKEWALKHLWDTKGDRVIVVNVRTKKAYIAEFVLHKKLQKTARTTVYGKYLVEPVYDWRYTFPYHF